MRGITVWKDGTWKEGEMLDAVYEQEDTDWLSTIKLEETMPHNLLSRILNEAELRVESEDLRVQIRKYFSP